MLYFLQDYRGFLGWLFFFFNVYKCLLVFLFFLPKPSFLFGLVAIRCNAETQILRYSKSFLPYLVACVHENAVGFGFCFCLCVCFLFVFFGGRGLLVF